MADTNIMLRYVQKDAERHAEVEAAVDRLIERGDEIVLVPQVMYEYWVVATRPYGTSNGLSYTTEEAHTALRLLNSAFNLFPDPPELYTTWLNLVVTHQVSGRQAHDARLAAAVFAHNLDASSPSMPHISNALA
ncbi:PIN domain-containing protein [Deinococcus sp. YIM 134068]|uniref:type II toxin-antitoxin system VapC family toxin n=1 Tax=Deinococcus lichenicola TaxID=3118910 RepID=UPI002F935599